MENQLELVPSFNPANVLFTKFKFFIGYSISVLTEAGNEGLMAISLMDYFEPVSIKRKGIIIKTILFTINKEKEI